MKIQELVLKNFRNYPDLDLNLAENLNIFIGDNAQGKTNIVEAIHYASLGISHRTRQDRELINWEAKTGKITLNFQRREVPQRLELYLGKTKGKEIIFNSNKIRQRDLPGILTMIIFSPEDLMLIKGAPQLRRRFMDIQLSQCYPRYYMELVKYNKLINQRNNLLKELKTDKKNLVMLELWDQQIAQVGGYLLATRLQAVEKMATLLATIHHSISQGKEELIMTYTVKGRNQDFPQEINNSTMANWLQQQLQSRIDKDIYRGSTSVGIHRDDLDFNLNNVDLKAYGSQGQQRSSVLSLKLAELEFLGEVNGEYPILLLDDVMSELDSKRRFELLALLRAKGIQTIITATDKTLFSEVQQGEYYYVEKGRVAK